MFSVCLNSLQVIINTWQVIAIVVGHSWSSPIVLNTNSWIVFLSLYHVFTQYSFYNKEQQQLIPVSVNSSTVKKFANIDID